MWWGAIGPPGYLISKKPKLVRVNYFRLRDLQKDLLHEFAVANHIPVHLVTQFKPVFSNIKPIIS